MFAVHAERDVAKLFYQKELAPDNRRKSYSAESSFKSISYPIGAGLPHRMRHDLAKDDVEVPCIQI